MNKVQPGDTIPLIAPNGGVVVGTAYLFGALLVVAAATAAQGEEFAGMVTGVFDLPKTTSEAWATVGARLYWDNSTKKLTTTATSNTLVGCVAVAAGANDTTGRVRLNGTVAYVAPA